MLPIAPRLSHAPVVVTDPWDYEAYLETLTVPPTDAASLQLQADWDRFVTFGNVPPPEPMPTLPNFFLPPYDPMLDALFALPSPQSRSITPSPLLPVLPLPALMERHVTGSPDVLAPVNYPPPILEVPPPAVPSSPAEAAQSSTSPTPTFVEADRTLLARSGVRQKTRRRVKEQPLHRTAEGREIIRLTGHAWYNAPSGFAVTQYPDTANWWRCNDVANYINWLDRGIRVHRSQLCRILAVENIEALNAVLTEQGYPAIVVKEAPPTFFPSLLGMGERQRDIPVFLRVGYNDRNNPQRLRNRKRPAPTP